jgi:hypothetical protein
MSIVAWEPFPGSRLVVASIVSGSTRLSGSWTRLSVGAGSGSRDADGTDVRPDEPAGPPDEAPDDPLGDGRPVRPADAGSPFGGGRPGGPAGGGVGVARPDEAGSGVDERVEPGPNVASSRATVCADVSSGGSGDGTADGARGSGDGIGDGVRPAGDGIGEGVRPAGGGVPPRAIVCADVRAGVLSDEGD